MAHRIDIATSRLATPLHTPFVTALRRATALSSVIVTVTDADGRSGSGEAPEVWRVTGETREGIEACVRGPLGDVLRAWDLTRPIGELAPLLDGAIVGNGGAKAACEVAVTSLVAARAGVPVHRLLGAVVDEVTTDMTVAADAAPMVTTGLIEAGFRSLKLKVGVDPDDIARVVSIWQHATEPVRIRIDANQGWDLPTAVAAITAWHDAGVDLEFVEQPLPAGDFAGHAQLRREVPVPIMLDESVFTVRDLPRALEAGSADLINIKLAKCGGLNRGIELARAAREGGVDVMVGSMMESRIGVAAAAALAAVIAPAAVHDLDAAWWSIDPAADDTPYRRDRFVLPRD
jgi:L-alanine-DL-glutamate epimerase-like enolase superfamily enzyme